MLSSARSLGPPNPIIAGLFDLDGVLTSTADQHRQAWKVTFDAVLAGHEGDGFRGFTDRDYTEYMDGRPQAHGVRQFPESRGIGNRKNERLLWSQSLGEIR